MELSQETLNTYDSRLLALEDKAYNGVYSRVVAYINKFPNAHVADIREYAIECVDAIANIYGNAAATCAANLYDELTEQTGQKYKAATVNSSDISSYIKKEAHYQAGKLVLGESLEFAQQMAMCAKDQVARCANQTMKENAKRDKIRYARVPMGGETCKFCIMLASRGFVYTSSKTAGEGNHYHSNCRCKVVPAFKGMTIQDYDTEELYSRWKKFEEIDNSKTIKGTQRKVAKSILSKNLHLSVSEVETLWQQQAKECISNIAATQTKEYTAVVKDVFKNAGESALKDMQHTLKIRNETPFESLYSYDLTTGKKIAAITDSTEPKQVVHTSVFNDKVKQAKAQGHEVAFMHNHPGSSLPSAIDLQSIAGLNVDFGVIACHNGDVIKYATKNDTVLATSSKDLQFKINRIVQAYKDEGKTDEQLFEMLGNELGVEIERFQFSTK